MFTTAVGMHVEPRNFVRAFKLICERNGLRLIRVHDVRHTVATMLKNLDVSPREAQLILGHSHVAVTQQIYQHGDMSTRRESLGRIETALTASFQTPKTPHADMAGELVTGVDGNGCRQLSRQELNFINVMTSFLSGATTGI